MFVGGFLVAKKQLIMGIRLDVFLRFIKLN